MERTAVFSKRFYGVTGMLIALIFTIGFLPQTAHHLSNYPPIFLAVVLLILVSALVGTVGWRYCLRQGTIRWMRVYFGVQLGIFVLAFILEMQVAKGGAATGNLLILILLQSSVLPRHYSLAVAGFIMACLLIISLPYQPPAAILGAIISLALTSGAVLLVGHLIVSEERARQAADEANRKLSEYVLQAEELAIANERNRIARDIHDNLGHYLSAVNMQIEASLAIIQTDLERAVTVLRKAQTLAKDGLADVRGSVSALRADPTALRPLHEALTHLVEEGQADGLTIHYRIQGAIRPCPAEVEMALYRIAQEGLTNIRKHAQASRADLELCYGADRHIRLNLRDNGQGSPQPEDGFGLLGIRERVKLLGGKLAIRTAQGQGFELQVEIQV